MVQIKVITYIKKNTGFPRYLKKLIFIYRKTGVTFIHKIVISSKKAFRKYNRGKSKKISIIKNIHSFKKIYEPNVCIKYFANLWSLKPIRTHTQKQTQPLNNSYKELGT